MNAQRAAELQVVLEGIPLPATREHLLEYARAEDPLAARDLERLPDGQYARLDDVGEALVARPEPPASSPRLPLPESGPPPGGDAYVAASPTSGAVRRTAPPTNPPQQTIQQQTKLQNEQKQRQDGG